MNNFLNLPEPSIFVSEEIKDVVDLENFTKKNINSPDTSQEINDDTYPYIIKIKNKGIIMGVGETYLETSVGWKIQFKTHVSESTLLRIGDEIEFMFGNIILHGKISKIRIRGNKFCCVNLSFQS